MSHIPQELIYDILSRLPVNPLLRFRCVSDSWRDLIDSRSFIRAHIMKQIFKPNSDAKLILKTDRTFLSTDYNSLTYSIQLQQLDHSPLNQLRGQTEVMGSCNGLVSILNDNFDDDESFIDDEYGIWNPSTRMFKKLPPCPQGQHPDEYHIRSGFGYDMIRDDYKVVKICQWYYRDDQDRLSLTSETMVYSLKSDLWKKVVPDCPYWLDNEDSGRLSGGALYWIAVDFHSRRPLFLLGLNLGSEQFDELPFPNYSKASQAMSLTVLGGDLCLLLGYHYKYGSLIHHVDYVDIWGMKDYGIKKCWMKFFSVEQFNGPHYFDFLNPIAYLKSANEVLIEIDHERLMLYNLEQRSLRPVVELDYFESFVCVGTLVRVYSDSNRKAKKRKIEPDEENGGEDIEKGDAAVI